MKKSQKLNPNLHYDLTSPSHVLSVAVGRNHHNEGIFITQAEDDTHCMLCAAEIPKGKDCSTQKETINEKSFTDIAHFDTTTNTTCCPCAALMKGDNIKTTQGTGTGGFAAVYVADPKGKRSGMTVMKNDNAMKVMNNIAPKGLPFIVIGRIQSWVAAKGSARHTAWKAQVNANPEKFYFQIFNGHLLFDKSRQKELQPIFDKAYRALKKTPFNKVILSLQYGTGQLSRIHDNADAMKFIKSLEDYTRQEIQLACSLLYVRTKTKYFDA